MYAAVAEKLQVPLHMVFTMPWTPTGTFPHPMVTLLLSQYRGKPGRYNLSRDCWNGRGGDTDVVMISPQARMLYTYKLPNGVLRLSDKAEYFADASEAYHNLARVIPPFCLS